MKGKIIGKKFGPFYYKICVEKSREIALAVRYFNPVFTRISYGKSGNSPNPIHPGIIFVVVQDAIESVLSWEGLPVLRSTLRCTGHHIRFHQHFRDGDVVKTVAQIKDVKQSSGKVAVSVVIRTRRLSDNKLICSGEWRYESVQ